MSSSREASEGEDLGAGLARVAGGRGLARQEGGQQPRVGKVRAWPPRVPPETGHMGRTLQPSGLLANEACAELV